LRHSQYPFAIEHYRLRFNKAKRRRPRIPPAQPNQPSPLDTKGWSVRQNFKLAAYSEYKQELDVAVKFYELAYNELIDLFSSTAILPPRTKRWTEARVLADSISYKLCKLLLYLGEHGRVIATFSGHNKRMSSLCNGWGLGTETAEYWAWLSRNYRIFAELLDISETMIVPEREIEEAMKMITGDTILNVDMVLQHPGYYYILAAECVRQWNSRTVVKEVSRSVDGADEKDKKEGAKGSGLNGLLFENLSLSAEHFGRRGNRRTAAYVTLAKCKSHHFAEKYDVALEYLSRL
jgi:trafficking protein particle complex subunit 11